MRNTEDIERNSSKTLNSDHKIREISLNGYKRHQLSESKIKNIAK